MFRQIFSELKKMFSIRTVYPVILAYLFSGLICVIGMSITPEGEAITYGVMIHDFCYGYILLALTLPFFVTNYIHNDYKSGVIRNMYAAWEDRRNIITVRWLAMAIFLFLMQLFGMIIASAIHILFKSTTKGSGSEFLIQYVIYYMIILHSATLCMLLAHLLKNTTFCQLMEIMILVPAGFIISMADQKFAIILKKFLMISQAYRLNRTLGISEICYDLIFCLLYITVMILIMRKFVEKEDLYRS